MGTYKKPIHEICVDKTSCRHEPSLQPTEQLTKDSIRKSYEQKQKDSGKE